ncbi:hypothetical protein E2320_000406, partial [Naja naja]
ALQSVGRHVDQSHSLLILVFRRGKGKKEKKKRGSSAPQYILPQEPSREEAFTYHHLVIDLDYFITWEDLVVLVNRNLEGEKNPQGQGCLWKERAEKAVRTVSRRKTPIHKH